MKLWNDGLGWAVGQGKDRVTAAQTLACGRLARRTFFLSLFLARLAMTSGV